MERYYGDQPTGRRLAGGLKDRPECERCGKPVKISSDDYLDDEILCAHCATDAKIDIYDDLEPE